MKLRTQIGTTIYQVELASPLDLSIPLQFHGPQPNSYNVAPASAKAYTDGTFIGDTRQGGSCNFEEYRLIPHCNGTHTECVGHIALERISLHQVLQNSLIPCTLISISPEPAEECHESCSPPAQPQDLLLTEKQITTVLTDSDSEFLEGLVVRTLPNESSKTSMQYMPYVPPYFTLEAMNHIVRLGVKHLLVDVPSVDRILDEGLLSTHHLFWNVPQGSQQVNENNCSVNTITEMVFVPDRITDGRYLLNLQVPSFVADAAPSRPILYPITNLTRTERTGK